MNQQPTLTPPTPALLTAEKHITHDSLCTGGAEVFPQLCNCTRASRVTALMIDVEAIVDERLRSLEAERDEARAEVERLRAELEWFADPGHYPHTYREGAGFVQALGLSRAWHALGRCDECGSPEGHMDHCVTLAGEVPRG